MPGGEIPELFWNVQFSVSLSGLTALRYTQGIEMRGRLKGQFFSFSLSGWVAYSLLIPTATSTNGEDCLSEKVHEGTFALTVLLKSLKI